MRRTRADDAIKFKVSISKYPEIEMRKVEDREMRLKV